MADGITPEQLVSQSKGREKASARPPKYRFTDHTDAEKTWTGQGRMPKSLAKAVAEGKSLESFLI